MSIRPREGSAVVNDVQTNEPMLGRNMWAVIIGITNYKHGSNSPALGATADADAFHECLERRFGVPSDHIVKLLDDHATRKNIIDSLYDHLKVNERIRPGDAIIVFFAGHGSRYKSPWHSDEFIEAIMPVDRGQSETPNGEQVQDISDRELNLFFAELRDVKGGNIIIILDCCHSGGGTRGIRSNGEMAVRFMGPMDDDCLPMLRAAESNTRKRWPKGAAMAESWTPDMTSHVLLAACKDDEEAYRSHVGGKFTRALLRQLWSRSLASATYVALLKWLDFLADIQQPVADGEHKDSLIFRIGQKSKLSVRGKFCTSVH
ncbi:uncharacterized protein LAESUDRAFT_503342 [Laetiporus sulphureus 93-53]|uniref:Peptidase C14 caspase domain-containing protein n=1 Tax=Laetiporus sulphureus 93-53 TaxID=1314785 RepID=A0A165BFI5_9APHY|nr:uncharacterized protein LAESUDRAFT_503342 [Laetiporus sulphureus 93-53]KZT00946.1 hypothetical protein LAESUDRAFT_503342 [Laetiporus sulphureus 93-53]